MTTVASYRIPRLIFLTSQTGTMNLDDYDEDSYIQSFEKEPEGMLMSFEYEYIEVSKKLNDDLICLRCIFHFKNSLKKLSKD